MEKITEMVWWDGVENPREACQQERELWKMTSFPKYAVSNMGRVASSSRGEWRIINGSRSAAGYIVYIEGKMGHQLVVLAFDGPAPSPAHTDIRHLDLCSSNNRLTNLEWGTRADNMMDVKNARLLEGKIKAAVSTEEAKRKGTWYGGRTWDKDLVESLVSMYQEKKIRLEDVARVLGVTTNALPACFKAHEVSVPLHGRRTVQEVHVIRNGIGNGMTLKELNELPELERKLTHQDFYYFKTSLGIATEYSPPPLMRGEEHGCAKLTEAQIYDVFTRIETGELKNMKEVQAALGVAKGIAYGIVAGRSWAHLTRSEALKAAVTKMQRQILSPQDQTAVIDALLAGEPREEIKARFNLSDSKLQSYLTKANKKKQNV